MFNKYNYLAVMLLLLSPLLLATEQLKTIKLKVDSPELRAVDRDWDYFKTIACNGLDQLIAHSQVEKNLINKRKSQCTNQYDAFFTKPLER